jgi:NEDD8-activating enzyme E1 regulatory subunit
METEDGPTLLGPTAKEKKYDRQLRLWGAKGQERLEESHVLLYNFGPGVVGIETLKNLILPGVGQYTIVYHDDPKVEQEDLGVNFFLDESCIGKPRAQMTCQFLQELNTDVEGHWLKVISSS